MTREEHLLVILSEESAEVIKEISKILRFGVDEKEPGQDKTNIEKLKTEINDFMAVIKMLVDDGFIKESDLVNMDAVSKKEQKIEKYLELSKHLGR